MSFSDYAEAGTITYTFPAVNFGANTSRTIRGPKGKRGRVIEVQALVTTSFVGTTAAGRIRLGDGVTVDRYVDMPLGTPGSGPAAPASVNSSDVRTSNKDPDGGIAPDSNLVVSMVAPVGTPAGVADVVTVVNWY
jgi:hypothetical protein